MASLTLYGGKGANDDWSKQDRIACFKLKEATFSGTNKYVSFLGEGGIKVRVIIDRFEGDYALVELEDGSVVPMPVQLLPGAREGDVVEIRIDRAETVRRKKLIQELQKRAAETGAED